MFGGEQKEEQAQCLWRPPRVTRREGGGIASSHDARARKYLTSGARAAQSRWRARGMRSIAHSAYLFISRRCSEHVAAHQNDGSINQLATRNSARTHIAVGMRQQNTLLLAPPL